MYISEGQVSLRDFAEEDIQLKVEWINDSRNNRFLHYDIPLDYHKTLIWFHNRNLEKRLDCTIEYGGTPVGVVGLIGIDFVNQKAEYYITIGSHEHKSKGIATIASGLILRYAFEVLKLNKVYLNVDAENLAACALYEKIGMKCEGYFQQDLWHRGRLVDRKRYAILKDPFLESRCTE